MKPRNKIPGKEAPYYWMAAATIQKIRSSSISGSDKALARNVYLAIIELSDIYAKAAEGKGLKDGAFETSMLIIANSASVATSTARRGVNTLCSLGILHVKREVFTPGSRQPNTYTLLSVAPEKKKREINWEAFQELTPARRRKVSAEAIRAIKLELLAAGHERPAIVAMIKELL